MHEAVTYAVTGAGLFASSAILSLLGWHPHAVALYPIPVGLYMALGRSGKATALAGLAGLAGGMVWPGSMMALFYALGAATGIPLGIGLARQWRFGTTMAVFTAATSAVAGLYFLAAWDAWLETGQEVTAYLAQWLQAQDVDAEQREQLKQRIGWFAANWANVSIGMVFVSLFLASAAAVQLSSWIGREFLSMPGLCSRFHETRLPDGLVWMVIGVALAWLADWHQGGSWLRPVAWNTAIGLAAVYWLNGFSIVSHGVAVLQAHRLVYPAAFLLASMPQFRILIATVGLFDTWADFRTRIDTWKARRASEGGNAGHDDNHDDNHDDDHKGNGK